MAQIPRLLTAQLGAVLTAPLSAASFLLCTDKAIQESSQCCACVQADAITAAIMGQAGAEAWRAAVSFAEWNRRMASAASTHAAALRCS